MSFTGLERTAHPPARPPTYPASLFPLPTTPPPPTPQSERSSLIPADTRVDSYISINKDTASCDLVLKTSSEQAVIRGVVVFGEQIFDEESLFVYPKNPDVQVGGCGRPGREGRKEKGEGKGGGTVGRAGGALLSCPSETDQAGRALERGWGRNGHTAAPQLWELT